MSRRLLLAITFAVTCTATCLASARADAAPRSASPAEAQARAQAQQWFARGVTAARTGDLAGARRAFATAYGLVPSVDILWNLAAAERLAGDHVAALQHLRAYVAAPDARADRKKVADDDLVPELESVTARLRIDEPEGSVVVVDGKEVARAITLDVAPGVHAVQVRRGDEERSTAVDAVAGKTTTLGQDNGAERAASASSTSNGPAAAAAPAPSPIVVAPFAPAPAEIVTRAPGRTTAVFALGGAALAAIATGVVFAVVAREDQADADRLEVKIRDDDRTCRRAGTLCADYDSATGAAQRSMLLSSSMLATGGVLGGAAIAAWILWPSTTTKVVPMTGKDVAGLGVTGRF